MIDSIGLNLVVSGLASVEGTSNEKIRETLRRKHFSPAIDGLTTASIAMLQESVETAHIDTDGDAVGDIDTNWSTITEELDDLPVEFDTEREAIVRLADAIMTGIGISTDTYPAVRDTIEAAVADAYQEMLRTFVERIRGAELLEGFENETALELTTAVDVLTERLQTVRWELRQQEIAALRSVGFDRLDTLYFERHRPGDPAVAWRTGFSLTEVEAGFPLFRERPVNTSDERRVIADDVFERLVAGENVAVLGDGGSGKRTLCKQVACQWHADSTRGVVLYRDSVTTTAFDAPDTLIEAIRATRDELLIVIEDASNGTVTTVLQVLDEIEHSKDVAILLSSTDWKWHTNTGVIGRSSLKRQRQQFAIVEMPALDERECQRALEHYRALTGVKIEATGEEVYEEIRDADVGEALMVASRLTDPGTTTAQSALHAAVNRTYTAIEEWAGGDTFVQTVTVMINTLNAARLPVEPAFVHALADDHDEHRAVERTLDGLDDLLFEQTDERRRLPHPLWSVLYLERMLEVAGEAIARDRFEQCVDALFRLVDEEARRETVCHWLHSDPAAVDRRTETPEAVAEHFVRRIADSGTMRPALGTLYGTPETWAIRLPESCPVATHLQWHITRGNIHLYRGAFDAAQAELDRLNELIESQTEEPGKAGQRKVTMLDSLVTIAWMCGDLAAASEFYENSLPLPREMDDRNGDAHDLVDLGVLTCNRWVPEIAHEYHEETLVLAHQRNNRRRIARCLTNLGVIDYRRSDLEAAREYLERALTIEQERGDRHRIARCLTHLGTVAHKRGDHAVAYEYHERALTIEQERDNRHGIARCLTHLGRIDTRRGNLEAAETHLEDALTIRRELGDRYGIQQSLSRLRDLAYHQGDDAASSEYHAEVHALYEEIGNGERVLLERLGTLGQIAEERGDRTAAMEYYEKILAIYRGVGNRSGETNMLTALGQIADKNGDRVAAMEYHKQELEVYQGTDRTMANVEKARTLVALGRITGECGNREAAEKCFEEAISIFTEDWTVSYELDRLADRVDMYEQRGDVWQATTYCEQAIVVAERTGHETERTDFEERRSALLDTDGK